jgi:hypothetical protein
MGNYFMGRAAEKLSTVNQKFKLFLGFDGQ